MRVVAVCLIASAIGAGVHAADLNDPPPRAALIAIGVPDATQETELRGNAGAASAGSTLIAVNLDTGHYASTSAGTDGSFALRLYAPAGTHVLLKVDPAGRPVPGPMLDVIGFAGTILRVPEPAAGSGIGFAGASFTSWGLPTVWRFAGSLTNENATLRMQGTIIIESPSVDGAGTMRGKPQLLLERLSEADGKPVQAQASFSSTFVTPTGLPIERLPWSPFGGFSGDTVTLQKTAPGRAEAAVAAQMQLSNAVKPGYYRTILHIEFEGARFPNETPSRPVVFDLKAIDRASRKPGRETGLTTVYGPVVRVGDPAAPRMNWMLLVNHPNEGTRGTRAIEDRQSFGFAPRVVTQSDIFIVPRGLYNLEPFVPAIGIGDREFPSPPRIPFRFPSGELLARVTRPDGSVTTIGPAPFAQWRTMNATRPGGGPLESGGGFPHDPYQLSTMNPAFEFAFDRDGKHIVRLEGWIEDVWGHRWEGSGTYEILVAKPMALDTAVLPGSPFEAGDVFDPAMQLIPPAGADVEVRVRLLSDSDPARTVEFVRSGRANRFGLFRANGIPLDARGEYRADAVATWRDPDGVLHAGSRTWGGVVAPRDAAIVAHGMRGADDMPAPRPIWFRRETRGGSGHIHVPFFSGDVLWAVDQDAAIPHITFADPLGKLTMLRDRGVRFQAPPGFVGRYDTGEARPFIGTPTGTDAHIDSTAIDVWGYAYRSVQRPFVRVREIIGEEAIAGYYWRFGGSYGGQRGMGPSGDMVNDFKFQFGGIVLRGPALPEPQYAIYSSLFVLAPDDGPNGGSRVFPPFRGNGGGPDGGPLMTLKGKDVEMFLHLTGVRPGTIAHRGQSIAWCGYVAPPVAAKVSITVTSPSGAATTVEGRANRIGWFRAPGEMTVSESGVWTARVSVTFEGPNTSGAMAAPYPSGGVLGTVDGSFHFYVVDVDAPELALSGLTVLPPPGLTGMQLAHTITMPGFLLQEESSPSMAVVYDAPALTHDFPNLDADPILISFLLSGTDATGVRRHFARSVVLEGDIIEQPSQPPVELRRRRSARH